MEAAIYPYQELAFCRPHGATLALVTDNETVGDAAISGCHLMVVDRPLFVTGYHFAGRNIPSSRSVRLWTYRSSDKTLLPYGPAISGSDTFQRTINPGATADRRDTARPPVLRYSGAGGAADERFVDIQLPNGFLISVPGIYYAAIMMETFAENEEYFGSYIRGYSRGVRDCLGMIEGAIDDETLPAVMATLVLEEPLHNQNWAFPTTSLETVRLCNIDIAFITEDRKI